MSIVTSLVAEVSKEVIKLVSGKVLTENQIQGISKHVVGRYFADVLTIPENEAEADLGAWFQIQLEPKTQPVQGLPPSQISR
jgi:hypothetical protein